MMRYAHYVRRFPRLRRSAGAGLDPRALLTTLRGLRFRILMITDNRGPVAFDDRWSEDLELRAELWCEPQTR